MAGISVGIAGYEGDGLGERFLNRTRRERYRKMWVDAVRENLDKYGDGS